MKIVIKDIPGYRKLLEEFNEGIETLKNITLKKATINEEIYYIDQRLLDYKAERQRYYNARKDARENLSSAKTQLGEVKERMKVASPKKREYLEPAQKLLEQNIQEFKRDEQSADDNIKLYDEWILKAEQLKQERGQMLEQLANEFAQKAEKMAYVSKFFQMNSCHDYYMNMILSILDGELNGRPITINDFKFDMGTVKEAEETGERE